MTFTLFRYVAVALCTAVIGVGCADDASEGGTSRMALVAGALGDCSGANGDPFNPELSLRVRVTHPNDPPAPAEVRFDQTFGLGGGSTINVPDVPEGTNEEVTLIGSQNGEKAWFGRKSGVIINQGRDNNVSMALSKIGGYSCPKANNDYTHRMFPTVTPLGDGRYFVAGGLTTVNTAGVLTLEAKTESSKKAFVYDSVLGTLTRVGTLMQNARGAHGATLVRGAVKNRVVLFGGTGKLSLNPTNENGFGWSFEDNDAIKTVEVFEYDAGGDPAAGQFLTSTSAATMLIKRVFPTVNVISTDGLVMVCGGGPWGGKKAPEYKECDVFDAQAVDTLGNEKPDPLFIDSNNLMNQYRAGLSSQAYVNGEVTKIIFYGGGTEGEVVETYTSSTAQRAGTGGTFRKRNVDGTPHSFFQTLTALGTETTVDDQQNTHVKYLFALIGGVNWNGQKFDAPDANNAYIIKVEDAEPEPIVTAEGLGGLAVGRYFHAAQSVAGDRLAVLGGFTGNDLTATDDVRLLAPDNPQNPGQQYVGLEGVSDGFKARGGLASFAMDNDTILLVGGISGTEDLESDHAGAIEVYTPKSVVDAIQ